GLPPPRAKRGRWSYPSLAVNLPRIFALVGPATVGSPRAFLPPWRNAVKKPEDVIVMKKLTTRGLQALAGGPSLVRGTPKENLSLPIPSPPPVPQPVLPPPEAPSAEEPPRDLMDSMLDVTIPRNPTTVQTPPGSVRFVRAAYQTERPVSIEEITVDPPRL